MTRHRKPIDMKNLFTYLLLAVLMLMIVAPFFSVFLASFKTPAELVRGAFSLPENFSWDNYRAAWEQGHFRVYTLNSTLVVFWVIVLGSFLSILAGYAFAQMRFPLDKALFIVFLLGLMVPQESYIVPLYYFLSKIGLVNTIYALIIPQVGMSVCFGIFWMRGFFAQFPRDLLDAAEIDGCNRWSILWRIIVPNSIPAITTMVVLFFVWTWNDFFLALVMISSDSLRTLPLGLALFQGRWAANIPLVAAGATLVTLPSLFIYVFLQRQFILGATSGSLHGS